MKKRCVNPGYKLRQDRTHNEAVTHQLIEVQTCTNCNDTPVELEKISKDVYACVHCGGVSNCTALISVHRGYKQ